MSVLLSGATVWITGAGSGLGLSLAKALLQQGNFVIVSGRNKEAFAQLTFEHGKQVKVVVCDVTDEASLVSAEKRIAEVTDYLDCVIACAGICEYEDDLQLDASMYQHVLNVNFLGVVRTLRIAQPLLARSERKAVFAAVGSLVSQLPFPRAEAYGASKAALEYWVKSVYTDTHKMNWRICLIRPGFVKTPMTAKNDFNMPFLMSPEDGATAIIRGLEKGQLIVDFPRRFSWMLKLLSLIEGLWLRWITPKMTRVKYSRSL